MTTFESSVVLVTGGGAGIGRATAELFAALGAKVAILDLSVAGVPSEWLAFQGSVTSDADVEAAIAGIDNACGRLDILVNNAGISCLGTIEDGTLDDWFRVLDVNLISVARVSRAALPLLRKSGHASIVNLASCLAQTGLARRAIYSASKGGVEALTRAMAADLVAEGIRVNCVNPGTVNTEFVRGLAEKTGGDLAVFSERQVTGHMVEPEEVAHAIAYLARSGARSTVGTVLSVEAGFGQIRG